MSDFRWFKKWNDDNPKNIIGPGILAGTVGVAIIAATFIVIKGYPWPRSEIQTGPRGSGMFVVKSAAVTDAGDPTAATFYSMAPTVPTGGETLASDAYDNAEPLLGDLTAENYDRLVEAMRRWTGIPDLFGPEETYQTVVARRMIQMTQYINEEWGDHVAPAGVTCYTCHRGQPVPSEVWFQVTPVVNAFEGWSANQNRVTPNSAYSSLPSDALMEYFINSEPIRVHDLAPRVANEGTATIQQAERTFSLMNYFSNSLDANCTFCHNTRALYDLEQSTPQLLNAQLGIAMVQDLNYEFLLPLDGTLPPERLGPVHADVPKLGCGTCHKGYTKPLGGLAVTTDWPELTGEGPPVYE
jgi:photosynthetic reaction center cytochrome c subunit